MSIQSEDTAGWVSLKYILASTRAALRIDDKHDEFLLQYIIDGVTELNTFHLDISGTKNTTLTISDINTVQLPRDYIDYAKIGIIVNGRIHTLTVNPNLAVPHTGDCGEDTNAYQDNTQELPATPQFGISGGYNVAEYKIDKRNRRIIVSGNPPGGTLYLEYISSGISMSEETNIPRAYVPVIRAYAIWRFVDNDPSVPGNEKERKGRLYGQEVRRAAMYELPTLDEMVDALKQGRRQTPKA